MELQCEQRLTMPIPEVSGLGWRLYGAQKQRQLLILGDRTFQIGFAAWSEGALEFEVRDLRAVCGAGEKDESQWEAIAGDASGRVFALRETPGAVVVFSPELDRIEHTIQLQVPKDNRYAEAWERDENSRGEGLVLLRSGHLLVLKEKAPTMLLEFGPAGATPLGYQRTSAVTSAESFPLPKGIESVFVPLHAWHLSKSAQTLVGDLSDLAVNHEGKLFALSDQEQLLVRLESNLRVDEAHCSIKEQWTLPSAIAKPEGLAMTEQNKPIVARDTKKGGGNSYLLSSV